MLGPLIARSLVVAVYAALHELLMAQSGHYRRAERCPISGGKQTWFGLRETSAYRTWAAGCRSKVVCRVGLFPPNWLAAVNAP